MSLPEQFAPQPDSDNPLLRAWAAPFAAPPFGDITPAHFHPAFTEALASHRAEIAAIAEEPAQPTFANTVDALELSGRTLRNVSAVFFNLAGADTNEAIQAIEREMAPVLAQHRTAIFMNAGLWKRIEHLTAAQETLALTDEQRRVLERYRLAFVRQGAALPEEKRKRLAEIAERLAVLGTQFGQNMLADEASYALVLDGEADLAGLPDWLRQAAAKAAEERGVAGKHVITLSRSSIEPFLQFSTRRDLRETVFRAFARARREQGQERQPADHCRNGAPPGRTRPAPRL